MYKKIYIRKPWRYIIFAVVTLFVIYLGHKGMDWLFTIDTILVEGENVRVLIDERTISKNLLFFPSQTVSAKILLDNPLIESIQFRKKFPHTLVVVAQPRVAFATLVTAKSSVTLDSQGVIVDILPQSSLPVISIDTTTGGVGTTVVETRVSSALAFLRETKTVGNVARITIYDSSSLQAKLNDIDILFTQHADLGKLRSTLQTLLSSFRIRGTMPTVIDLRYDKPVVRF